MTNDTPDTMTPDEGRYADWITTHVEGTGYGKCVQVCEAMAKAFPELSIRRGLFHDIQWGERTHAWLRTPSGKIIDPTGRQHPCGALFPESDDLYEDVTDLSEEERKDRIPSGVCPNCGEPCYRGEGICSKDCEVSYTKYLMGGAL